MVKIANRLKPEQWSLIIKAATSHAKQKKVIDLSLAIDLVDKTPSSDIEIVDGDFDSDPEVYSDDEDSNADSDGPNSGSDIDMHNGSD
jgi:hypothetical protein